MCQCRLHQGFFTSATATFQQYTTVPAEIVAKVSHGQLSTSTGTHHFLQIPDNISFDEAASIPLGLATGAVGLYHPIEKNGAGFTAPWEGGEGKYPGQGILIFGGSSSVGQYSMSSKS